MLSHPRLSHPRRKRITLLAAALIALAATAAVASSNAARPAAGRSADAVCSTGSLNLVSSGQLTIGTDNPAYPPWYAGGTPKGSSWKINDPSTGKGYESAVAYAIAKQLGFGRSQVKWTYVPFNKAFAPGPKKFDFDINQISYTPARAKVVSFSASYYDVNQAIVVNKGTKIASVRSIKGLAGYKLGAQLGTTSYSFINDRIKPSHKPAVYPSNAGAVLALKNKQIDGLVVDLPTAFYVTAVQVPNSKILGQFENKGATTDRFGVVLAKGNSLTSCVNKAINSLRANGTLKRLQQQWLAKATGAPILK
jgi:polar amino acid transport system substrate-binding protein